MTVSSPDSDLPPSYTKIHESTLDITHVEDEKYAEAKQKDDGEVQFLFSEPFEDKTVRLGFIQKVLTIRLLQLILAFAIMLFFKSYCYPFYRFMIWNWIHLMITSLLAFILTVGLMMWCDRARRKSPYKYMFLVAHPLTFTFFISSATYWNVGLQFTVACGIYCVVGFVLLVYSIFAMQTKLKFVTLHGILVSVAVQVILIAISVPIMYNWSGENGFYVVYPAILLTLEQTYVLFDLQVMTSKGYRIVITPDDFVDGAVQLHMDYGYIFVKYIVPQMRKAYENCIN